MCNGAVQYEPPTNEYDISLIERYATYGFKYYGNGAKKAPLPLFIIQMQQNKHLSEILREKTKGR